MARVDSPADWFVSDIHLSQHNAQLTQGFLAFLEHRRKDTNHLYILGDLFDYWIGDDYHTHIFKEVITALMQLRHSGATVYFCAGNRDFLVADDFYTQSGCIPLHEPHIITLFEQRTLLLHGDSLCTSDIDYMNLRTQLRNPQWQQEFLAKPIAERMQIAQSLRQQSQQDTRKKDDALLDVNTTEVNRCLEQHSARRMIHGHTHKPNRLHWQIGNTQYERIVLGDWGEQGWALRADPHRMSLESWPINTPP